MNFVDTGLAGAWFVEHAPAHDERSSFTGLWKRDASEKRGMHLQTVPCAQTKIGSCIAGKYSPQHARGVRRNDPAFGIRWPAAPAVIATRDAQYADFGA